MKIKLEGMADQKLADLLFTGTMYFRHSLSKALILDELGRLQCCMHMDHGATYFFCKCKNRLYWICCIEADEAMQTFKVNATPTIGAGLTSAPR